MADASPADAPEAQTQDASTDAPEVPAGANNPDAVKHALESERSAAKEARKRAEAAEAKVREFEDRDKSETEKLSAKVGNLTKDKASLELQNLRLRVAIEKQLPVDFVDRLRGDTPEELAADADTLLALVKSRTEPEKEPDFDGGAREPAPNTDPAQAHNDLVVKLFGGNS